MSAVDLTQAVSPEPSPRQVVGQVGGRKAASGPAGEAKGDGRVSTRNVAPQGGEDETGPGKGAAGDVGLARQVEEAGQLADVFNRSLSFELNREVDRVVISVIEADTGRVIRKIPPEEMLRVLKHLHETRGLILDAEG